MTPFQPTLLTRIQKKFQHLLLHSNPDSNQTTPIRKDPVAPLGKHPILVQSPPLILNLELTNRCPMKCCMCPRTYDMTRKLGFMDLHLVKRIFDDYCSFHNRDNPAVTWLHHFGESLLHPDFDQAIEYGSSKGLRLGLSVNPLALTRDKAKRLFQAKPARILLMLDGDSDESFYAIRGVKEAYEQSVNNALVGFKMKERYSPDTELKITIVDNPIFKEHTDNAEKFWKSEYNIQVHRKTFWTWNGTVEAINSMGAKNRQEKICHFPWNSVCISWDGNVVPCCADYDNTTVLGNIREKSLLEIWNDVPMQRVRQELRTGQIKNRLCSLCRNTIHI